MEPNTADAARELTIWALFMEADPIVKGVMVLLIGMSLWTWAVAFDKWMAFGEIEGRAHAFEKVFWSGQSLEELDDRYSDRPRDALARIFAAGAREWRDLRRGAQVSAQGASMMIDRVDRLMQAQIARELERAGRGFGVLASVGAAAPFIGLLGTVWGIMNAFTNIANEQQTNLAVVAPGIAEALFATALGLVAAIPAVVFYNKFTGDLDRAADRFEGFADEVTARLSRRLGERA